MFRKTFFAFLFSLCSFSAIANDKTQAEIWPDPEINKRWVSQLEGRWNGRFGYFSHQDYKGYYQRYTAFGDYLEFGKIRNYRTDGEIIMVEDGPRAVHEGKMYNNPVTLAEYALTMHGKMVRGQHDAEAPFRKATETLLTWQSPDGGFRYPITLDHWGHILQPGWVSSMAQGHALSVFARMHTIDKNPKFIEAGERALALMLRDVSEGGTTTTLADFHPSLKRYRFFPEYPSRPIDYTLNGYIFALLGLYDWSQVKDAPSREIAAKAFKDGAHTLERIIQYYDVGGYSAYDLSHLILKDKDPGTSEGYMACHVWLLHALNSIYDSPKLKHYEKKWEAKLDELNSQLRIYQVTATPQSPQLLGTPITLKMVATQFGAKPSIVYQFAVKYEGEWTFLQMWSKNNEIVWNPTEPGEYTFGLYVKSETSTEEFDNFQPFPFTISEPPGYVRSLISKEAAAGSQLSITFHKEGCESLDLGSIDCTATYRAKYDTASNRWTVSGAPKGSPETIESSYEPIGNAARNISIWGVNAVFDKQGTITIGKTKIGTLNKQATEGE